MSISNVPNFELYYKMSANGLGWCNVDRLARLPNSILLNLEVELTGVIDEKNVQLVLHLSDQNLVLAGRKGKNGKYNFNQSDFKNWIQLPEGEEAQIIAMSNMGKECSMGAQKITLEPEFDLRIRGREPIDGYFQYKT